MKLKVGDTVIVTRGKDRGKKGKIERVDTKSDTVTLPGINVYKKHMKRRDEKKPGGIIDVVRPLRVSNVALLCPSCGKMTRVGYLVMKGEKERICRKCHQRL
jgi:large subunit ribosomal protein L24